MPTKIAVHGFIAPLLILFIGAELYGDTFMLSPSNANRTRSDALTGNSEGSSPDLVGNVSSSRAHRTVLAFDLSSIPNSASITAVTLTGVFNPDGSGNSVNTDDGTGDITVQEMLENPDRINGWNFAFQSFGPDMMGNSGDETAWLTPGGTLGGVLSSVSDSDYDPEGIAAGTTFTWGTSGSFISAIQGNLGDDELLLQVLIPGVEGGSRSFIRDQNNWQLSIEVIPEPTSAVVILGCALIGVRRRR